MITTEEQRYALVRAGLVESIIVWDGNADNWQPPEGCAAVAVPEGAFVSVGYEYSRGDFVAPPAPLSLPPAESEVLAQRDLLLAQTTLRIAPLQDAVDLGDATAAELAALKVWKRYRVALNRIEQQPGFPAAVTWPKAPTR